MGLTRFLMLRLQGAPIDMPIFNGKSSPTPPAAPDPRVQIEAEARARPSVFTPFGSAVYTGNPADGTYRQDINLSPEEQALYKGRSGVANALLGRSGGMVNDLGGSFDGATDQASMRFFTNQKKLLDDVFAGDEERERQRLANQGIPEGSEAYTEAMDNFGRRKAEAVQTITDESFDRALAARQQNYNEIAAALGGAQLTPVTGGGGGLDTAGAFANQQAGRNLQYQGQLAGYQGDVGTTNALIGAGGAIGAAAMI